MEHDPERDEAARSEMEAQRADSTSPQEEDTDKLAIEERMRQIPESISPAERKRLLEGNPSLAKALRALIDEVPGYTHRSKLDEFDQLTDDSDDSK